MKWSRSRSTSPARNTPRATAYPSRSNQSLNNVLMPESMASVRGAGPVVSEARSCTFGASAVDLAADDRDAVLPGRCVQIRDQILVGALARRCEAGYRRGDEPGVRQSLLCVELILCLAREDAVRPAPGRVDAALDEITGAIRQDPSRRWTVAELASRAALSRAQLTRRFVAHTGLSPARYLVSARIERAHQLLTETTMSVTRVAGILGYADVAYFSRQYKRRTGRSPGDVRSDGGGVPLHSLDLVRGSKPKDR